jgi:hypothetical protein
VDKRQRFEFIKWGIPLGLASFLSCWIILILGYRSLRWVFSFLPEENLYVFLLSGLFSVWYSGRFIVKNIYIYFHSNDYQWKSLPYGKSGWFHKITGKRM